MYGSPTNKKLKKKHSSRMVGGEEMGSRGGKDAGKVAAGRLDMQINWEEKRGSNTDCTTQDSTKGK